MGLSTTHLIIFLVIIVVIFGTKKLRNIGSDLGGAVKGFKDGMKNEAEKSTEDTLPQQVGSPTVTSKETIDVESRTQSKS
tara:strand:- start:1348 stop:1587 length:240 start_codon:yes stop_codon:yes gene_type:complete